MAFIVFHRSDARRLFRIEEGASIGAGRDRSGVCRRGSYQAEGANEAEDG
jgi:hypothetical protein